MSHINQNGQDHDSEGLPPSVRRYDYKDKDQFAQILTIERERLLDSMRSSREISDIDTGSGRSEQESTTEITEYIIFSIDPTTFNQDFLSFDTIPNLSIRTSYNPDTKTLIVKMVTGEHTGVAFEVHKAIDRALLRMGLDGAINQYSAVDIDVNGRNKQADMGWGPRRPPPGCPKRPSVVLEVAVSETKKKILQDVDLWLDPLRGNANVVIAIKLSRRAIITIDSWIWDTANGKSTNSQHIEVSENENDEVKLSGGPLLIPFRLLFLRDPETPRETDVIIGNEWLKSIAERGWEMQFSNSR
ncbi:unnamed protein product [Penicillium salamii]|uniref:Uncharacterized protein n=1 Tax=Penicillium salamii TaxID=1612424 RepID=A0A9W4NNK6_9EURO|nr:unnamed protein product [Penicillium salamii]CAG8242811.1 unnamed protein product [Penicillium salamii]CAG8317604.1 unnamed protein product [Penicillium salamii]CAG8389182.1 unnamed protein product [Penicillium salamii]CAG8391754.1 unnamed protein product [Penicillium salamii]